MANSVMFTLTLASLLLVVVIGVGLYLKASPLMDGSSLSDLLWSSQWQPMQGNFGFLPFLMSTLWVTAIAIIIAAPISLLCAVFLTEYSKTRFRKYVFPALDILGGLPSIIYGIWGILLVVPWISTVLGPAFDVSTTGYSMLAGGIVLGIMILPLLVSLFIEIFTSVPSELREAAVSLGATKWQTTKAVVLRKTLPGIVAAIILALSRAFGETIAVLMVCGSQARVPHSVFDNSSPLPALIAAHYGEMASIPLYDAALMFAALILFVVVLFFNLGSRMILYRIEKTFF
jgi:phosphate transport system permease protein